MSKSHGKAQPKVYKHVYTRGHTYSARCTVMGKADKHISTIVSAVYVNAEYRHISIVFQSPLAECSTLQSGR